MKGLNSMAEIVEKIQKARRVETPTVPPMLIRESAVLSFRNGCVAAYVEQEDGTYKIVIQGEMYPRHLRAINEIFEIFKECSKEDRPAKTSRA